MVIEDDLKNKTNEQKDGDITLKNEIENLMEIDKGVETIAKKVLENEKSPKNEQAKEKMIEKEKIIWSLVENLSYVLKILYQFCCLQQQFEPVITFKMLQTPMSQGKMDLNRLSPLHILHLGDILHHFAHKKFIKLVIWGTKIIDNL